MSYPKQLWAQLKNLTADELVRALDRAGWVCDMKGGSMRIYLSKDGRRVSVHYHPGKTYGAKMLQGLLGDIGWSESEMRSYKLI